MKKIDDTPVFENESEDLEGRVAALDAVQALTLIAIQRLQKRIANLETQRTPQDENDDPEWY